MELNEIQNWSYDQFDKAIVANENKIMNLEHETKLLRQEKSKKTMSDSLAMITDSKIDFSLADLQAFLQSKKNLAITENGQSETPTVEEPSPVVPAKENGQTETPVVEEPSPVVPATEQTFRQDKLVDKDKTDDDFLNTPSIGEQNNSAEELFEDVVQPANTHSEAYKRTAQNFGLSEDVSLAKMRAEFEKQKNALPPALTIHYEELIRKFERGENV